MYSSQYVDDLLKGSKAEVEKELFIRFIRPRLEARPCYSEQVSICEITDEIEDEVGGFPRKQSLQEYDEALWFNLCWVWAGCLVTVLLVNILDSRKRLTQNTSEA
jgi:hypothetical protein